MASKRPPASTETHQHVILGGGMFEHAHTVPPGIATHSHTADDPDNPKGQPLLPVQKHGYAEYQLAELNAAKRDDIDDSDFALTYTDADGDKQRKLPIHDKGHVTSAMSYFSSTQFPDAASKKTAARKILAAAKKFGIEVSADNPLNAGGSLPGQVKDNPAKASETVSLTDLRDVVAAAEYSAGELAELAELTPWASLIVLSTAGAPYHPVPYHRGSGETAPCPSCGRNNDTAARYCDQCGFGTLSPKVAYQPASDDNVQCPSCGCMNNNDAESCDQCGTRLTGRYGVYVRPTNMAEPDDKVACPTCSGKGKIHEGHMRCPSCGGFGKVSPDRIENGKIKAAETGQVIALSFAVPITLADHTLPYLVEGDWDFPDSSIGHLHVGQPELELVVKHFRESARGQDLPVCDIDHIEPAFRGAAVGWVTDLTEPYIDQDPASKTYGKRRVDAHVDLNAVGEGLRENDQFRYVSPTLLRNWQHPSTGVTYPLIAAGVDVRTRKMVAGEDGKPVEIERSALALTNKPRLKELGRWALSEAGDGTEAICLSLPVPTAQLTSSSPALVARQLTMADDPDNDGDDDGPVPPCVYQPSQIAYSPCPGFTRWPGDKDGDGVCLLATRGCNGYVSVQGNQPGGPMISLMNEPKTAMVFHEGGMRMLPLSEAHRATHARLHLADDGADADPDAPAPDANADPDAPAAPPKAPPIPPKAHPNAHAAIGDQQNAAIGQHLTDSPHDGGHGLAAIDPKADVPGAHQALHGNLAFAEPTGRHSMDPTKTGQDGGAIAPPAAPAAPGGAGSGTDPVTALAEQSAMNARIEAAETRAAAAEAAAAASTERWALAERTQRVNAVTDRLNRALRTGRILPPEHAKLTEPEHLVALAETPSMVFVLDAIEAREPGSFTATAYVSDPKTGEIFRANEPSAVGLSEMGSGSQPVLSELRLQERRVKFAELKATGMPIAVAAKEAIRLTEGAR